MWYPLNMNTAGWLVLVFAGCGEVEPTLPADVSVIDMPITEWDDRNDPNAQWVYGPLTFADETESRRWILHPPPEFASEFLGPERIAECLAEIKGGAKMCSVWVEKCMNFLVFEGGNIQLDVYAGTCGSVRKIGDWQFIK